MTEPLPPTGPTGPPPVLRNPTPPPDVSVGGGGMGGFLRNRTAGIPNWAWLGGVVVVAGVGMYVYNRRKNSATSSSTNGGSAGSATVVDDSSGIATGQYETILSQLRDLQGAPSTGPTGPAGPAGPVGPSGGTGDTGPAGPTTVIPALIPQATDLSPRGRTVSVGTGANIYDFAEMVYGSGTGINTLRALNPGFDSWIRWSAPDANGVRTPTLIKGRPVKT